MVTGVSALFLQFETIDFQYHAVNFVIVGISFFLPVVAEIYGFCDVFANDAVKSVDGNLEAQFA